MFQAILEKRLLIVYSTCTVLGAIASITTGIAWGYWKLTLDQCVNGRNCSCILYGHHTPSKFLGGSNGSCIWVTFGPLFYVLFSISMACFHGYRVLFASRSVRTRTVRAKNEAGQMVQTRVENISDTTPLPKSFWITLSVFTGIFAIYGLIHFAIFLDGYYTTCNQYRKTVENLVNGIHGTVIPVIHNRLSCQSIFDFMDYVQPNSVYGIREGTIFTGADLILGIISSFFAWILFAYATFIQIKTARNPIN